MNDELSRDSFTAWQANYSSQGQMDSLQMLIPTVQDNKLVYTGTFASVGEPNSIVQDSVTKPIMDKISHSALKK